MPASSPAVRSGSAPHVARRPVALSAVTAITASALLSACFGGGVPPPSYARYNEYLPCSTRIGRCFDLSIAGQPVEVIEEESRQQALGSMVTQASYEIRDLYWLLAEPIDGARAFELALKPAGEGTKVLGPQRGDPALTVWSLKSVERPAAPAGDAAYSARRNDDVVASKLDLTGRTHLETGRYVFEVRYLGQLDWDRKFVYLTVR